MLELTIVPMEEVLEEIPDQQESTSVVANLIGIEMVKTVGSTHYLMGNLQVQFIGRLD